MLVVGMSTQSEEVEVLDFSAWTNPKRCSKCQAPLGNLEGGLCAECQEEVEWKVFKKFAPVACSG